MATILVVDDEELLRATLCQMLENAGYVVLEAANGSEALSVIEGSGVDLVISDIFMPEKDGIETIIQLRQRNPDLKIIAISGGGRGQNMGYLDSAKKFGAADVLAKPFLREEVLNIVRATLEGTE